MEGTYAGESSISSEKKEAYALRKRLSRVEKRKGTEWEVANHLPRDSIFFKKRVEKGLVTNLRNCRKAQEMRIWEAWFVHVRKRGRTVAKR